MNSRCSITQFAEAMVVSTEARAVTTSMEVIGPAVAAT
jgi:hypothetical protein